MMTLEALREELEAIAARREQSARAAFTTAERERAQPSPDEMGARLVEHGAVIHANHAFELRRLIKAAFQPSLL